MKMKLRMVWIYATLVATICGCVNKGYIAPTMSDIQKARHIAAQHIFSITHDSRYKLGSSIFPLFGKPKKSVSQVYDYLKIAKPQYKTFYPSLIDAFDIDVPKERQNKLVSTVGFIYPCKNKEGSVLMLLGKEPSGKWYVQAAASPKVLQYQTFKDSYGHTLDPVMQNMPVPGKTYQSNSHSIESGTQPIPTLSSSDEQDSANQSSCLQNTKMIGMAMRLYADDNDDRLPPANNWQPALHMYVKSEAIFLCPSAKNKRYSYGMNKTMSSMLLSRISSTVNDVCAFDSSLPKPSAAGGREAVDFRHKRDGGNLANFVFTDGHAKAVCDRTTNTPSALTVDQVLWSP